MKKFLCVVMSVVMFALMSSVNAFAIQEDVYKAYANELNWLNKTSSVEEYCVYVMNKDGIKELIVKTGTCEADYVYRFYSCEYGKIITLGTFSGGSAGLYECNANGVFVYSAHMGYETLYRVSKNGHKLSPYKLFSREVYDYHEPKQPIYMTSTWDGMTYSGLY